MALWLLIKGRVKVVGLIMLACLLLLLLLLMAVMVVIVITRTRTTATITTMNPQNYGRMIPPQLNFRSHWESRQ